MLTVPFFCFITAFGFAAFGIAVAGSVEKIDQFNYVTTLVITPLFLVAGTFFPIDSSTGSRPPRRSTSITWWSASSAAPASDSSGRT